jgi:hypothetical protein
MSTGISFADLNVSRADKAGNSSRKTCTRTIDLISQKSQEFLDYSLPRATIVKLQAVSINTASIVHLL